MKIHEYANIFPLMSGKEFIDLKKDIEENGQLEPIILYEDKILDGRNRYNAVLELGLTPKTEKYSLDIDPLAYVMSTNLKRRQLTPSQKAVVGVRWKKHYQKKYPQGTRTDLTGATSGTSSEKNRDRAAEIVGVGHTYIDIADNLPKEKQEKIMEGELTIKQAQREIKIKEQEEKIESDNLIKYKGEYDLIVIDPPWKVDHQYSENHYMGRVSNPYPEMTIEKIKNIKLPSKDDCVLWLWTTHSQIWAAKEIMKNWGFEYKAILVWNKVNMGIGHYLRKQCEFCLLGIKGNPIWKATDIRDYLEEKKTDHSTKPEGFYQLIDKYFVGRKLDYFARKKRDGWDVYGDEV